MNLWHPHADRVELENAGSFAGGGRKTVLHTTEGTSAAGAIAAYRANRSAPHFTLDPFNGSKKYGALYQHMPLNVAARALAHPSGPETNRANAIQVELVGFARDTNDWDEDVYERIRHLTGFIHRQFGVPQRCGVTFKASGAVRLSGQAFFDYAGIIGHQHVPGNDHTDPGDFRVGRLLPKGRR